MQTLTVLTLEWQVLLPLSHIPNPYFYFILFLSKLHTDFNNGCPNLYCYPQCKMVSFLYIPTEVFLSLILVNGRLNRCEDTEE